MQLPSKSIKIKKFKVILFWLIIFVTAVYIFLYAAYSFSRQTLLNQKIKNTNESAIIIHFTHGSIPKKDCTDQRSRLGGLWGGHVSIEIDGYIYGFGRKNNPVHIFPSKNFNAVFMKESRSYWEQQSESDKLTSITLPITNDQKENLKNECLRFCEKVPYDYATFGKRCTFSAYALLIDNKIFKSQSEFQIQAVAAYPALFRKVMVELAEKNNLKIVRKEGIDCRVWE